MRVLHVLGGLANSSGPTHIVLSLASHLSDIGNEVSVFYLGGRGLDTVRPEDTRIRLREFPLTWSRRWGYSTALRRGLREGISHFDVVHVHSLWMYLNLAAVRAARHAGVPAIIAPQGALDDWSLSLHGLRKRIYGAAVERGLLNAASAIQVVSPREIRNVRGFGVRTPCVLIPNGIDPAAFDDLPDRNELRRRAKLDAEHLVVLFLSRVHPKKGLDLLLTALPEVVRRCPRARLVIAGSDRGSGYTQTLRDMTRHGGIEDHVVFIGEMRGEDKRIALAGADVFVLSSYSEGQPVAALEAMAAGLPVVLTDVCNVPDVAERNAGRVISPDPAQVAQALGDLLLDDAARAAAGQEAGLLARERFAWRTIAERLHVLYGNVAQGREPGAGLD